MSTRESIHPAVYLLYTAAMGTLAAAFFFIIWLADKAQAYPEVQASQFGFEAPLWFPFGLFIGICAAVMAYMFTRAARRVKSGEDLFAKRHRRRPASPDDATEVNGQS